MVILQSSSEFVLYPGRTHQVLLIWLSHELGGLKHFLKESVPHISCCKSGIVVVLTYGIVLRMKRVIICKALATVLGL